MILILYYYCHISQDAEDLDDEDIAIELMPEMDSVSAASVNISGLRLFLLVHLSMRHMVDPSEDKLDIENLIYSR